jgi:mRNA interferase RelE/StbE
MYDVRLTRRAERGLRAIRSGDRRAYQRIVSVLRDLGEDPRPSGAVKLTGFDPPAWRVRVGVYRIVYEIDDAALTVLLINIAPPGDVYR